MIRSLTLTLLLLSAYTFGKSQTQPQVPAVNDSVLAATPPPTALVLKAFVQQLRGDSAAVLVDLRTRAELERYGSWSLARQIDYTGPEFHEALASLDRNTNYYLYCASGSRAEQAAKAMRAQGFGKVYWLEDAGWTQVRPLLYKYWPEGGPAYLKPETAPTTAAQAGRPSR